MPKVELGPRAKEYLGIDDAEQIEGGLRAYSPAAWSIASLYSRALASETRDLAGHIDAALDGARAEIERLRAALVKIQGEQLRIASATDMTRPAMREAAMETHNEIAKLLANEQDADR